MRVCRVGLAYGSAEPHGIPTPDIHHATRLVRRRPLRLRIRNVFKAAVRYDIVLAALEVQEHVQRMTGALLPIALVGSEASYPGKSFIYVGASTATTKTPMQNASTPQRAPPSGTTCGRLPLPARVTYERRAR